MQPGDSEHHVFPAASDISDSAGHVLVTAYALHRPDSQWSLLLINKDQENPHDVRVVFQDNSRSIESVFTGPVSAVTFGSAQYQWHPTPSGGTADPDGPAAHSSVAADVTTTFTLPKASITVLRGRIQERATGSRTED
jgi:hypothetical protein